MPPRPNDRGARLGTPLSAEEAVRQSSQSYDISSQGDEDDDFIGDDSEESLEGSLDSSGQRVARQQQSASGRAAPSSQGDSDDGFIAQDTSSGGEDYEARDAETEGDDDGPPEPGSPVSVTKQAEDQYTDDCEGDDGDDEQGGESVRALPGAEGDGIENTAAAKGYTSEDESDSGSNQPDFVKVDSAAAQRRMDDATGENVVRESTHDNRTASVAKEYMQNRLAMHLLPGEGSDLDDDATPRLPSLSARKKERQEEEEMLLLKAREQNKELEARAPDEDGEPTPRLDTRFAPMEDHNNGGISREQSDVRTVESLDQATVRPVELGEAHLEGNLTEMSSPRQVSGNESPAGNADMLAERVSNIQEGLEITVSRVVAQAIVEAGGAWPGQLNAGNGDQRRNTTGDESEGEEEAAPSLAEDEGQAGTHFHAERSFELDAPSLHQGLEMPQEADQEMHREDPLVDQEHAETQGNELAAARRQQEADDAHRIPMGDRDISQADEGLQISVTAEAYLYEERLDVDVPKPAPSSFAGYSTKLNASDNEESSTRPSSRTSSIGSSTNTIGRLKPQYAHQPRPQTRIQERSARDASREESGESGQESRRTLRENSKVASNTAPQDDVLSGRPDWNFETVKPTKSLKERYRYEPPPIIPGSKWKRAEGQGTLEKSRDALDCSSDAVTMQNSQENLSWDVSDSKAVESKLSNSSFSRAREYWATRVRTSGRRKKRCRGAHRPATGLSSLASEDSADYPAAPRPGTSEGYAARFRYNVQGTRGGAFGQGNPKSDVDWKIYDSKSKPAPGQYTVQREDSTPSSGGKILAKFDAIGSVQWQAKKTGLTPGPGHYDRDLNERPGTSGGCFAQSNRWQETEVFEQRSRELPGPTEYDAGDARDRVHKRVGGGAINDGKVMSELDWTLMRGSRTPGPTAYRLPPVGTTKSRAKGGRLGSEPRLRPLHSTAAENPGPGAYFEESVADRQKEIALRRSKSRASVATSCSRASLGRERSHESAPKGHSNRRFFLDDVQTRASKLPGPGYYEGHHNTVSHKTSRQPIQREAFVSRPGSSDPVVYSVGQAQRSSIVSDYRAIKTLQRSWSDSANEFKALLESFISSHHRSYEGGAGPKNKCEAENEPAPAPADHEQSEDSNGLYQSPLQASAFIMPEDTRDADGVFLTQL